MLTSLYIHIPFCNQICTYCDFHKELATLNKKEKYINALVKELKHYKDDLVNIKTIYIGGGTPSSLDLTLLQLLLTTINEVVDLENVVEYSIETNPNDLTEEVISLIKECGINRVSVGVQTFNQSHLEFLGRTHTTSDIYEGIRLLKEFGIKNISVDMIFSLINQTVEELDEDLSEVVKLGVNHISYYSLILEERTKLYYLYEHEKISMNSEDLEGLMYNKVIDYLSDSGYPQYEISNFCKPGFESVHNQAYWLNEEYLGLGSGSHSLYKNKRFSSPSNVTEYTEYISNDIYDFHDEYDYSPLVDELIMGLRLNKGINIKEINVKYNVDLLKLYPEIYKFITNNIVEIIDGNLRFTRDGILLGNEVFAIFVEVE